MSGGSIQLITTSSADTVLYGDPQITAWKAVWRRPTSHATEAVLQSWNGTADFGRKCSANISKTGDLCHRLWVQVVLPGLPNTLRWTNAVGLALLKQVECELGGTVIDRQVPEWMDCWSELSLNESRRHTFNRMVGRFDDWDPRDDTKCLGADDTTLYVPLVFWFSGDEPGNALPLVAITYHSLRINIEFQTAENLVVRTDPSLQAPLALALPITGPSADIKLYADLVYLTTPERRRWARLAHEQLVTQVQTLVEDIIVVEGNPQRNRRIVLPFSHPIKELVWVYAPTQPEDSTSARFFDYKPALDDITIYVNQHERQTSRPRGYWTMVQPFQHHTRASRRPVYVYSFALTPETMQPSGSINANVLTLELAFRVNMPERTRGKLMVFAVSYNVLRIANGLAGLSLAQTS